MPVENWETDEEIDTVERRAYRIRGIPTQNIQNSIKKKNGKKRIFISPG